MKVLLATALAATSLLGVATAQTTDYEGVDPSGQQITYWHPFSDQREETLNQIVQAFNTSNEYGVTVTAAGQGDYGDLFQKMLPLLNTDAAPDLVVAYQNQAATYQLGNALVDMTPLVESSTWGLSQADLSDFYPNFLEQDVFPTFNNERLGFPPNRSMEMLYYNTDWLQELGFDGPPQTPDAFREMTCAASKTAFSGATGGGSSTGYELDVADASHVAAWTFAFGGNIYDNQTNQYTYDSPATTEAMTFLQGLINDGCITVVTEQYGDQTDFGAGRTLFTTGSTSGLPYYTSAVDDGAEFTWSVGALPHKGANPAQDVYGASVSIPKHNPEQEVAAWLFVKYLTSPDVQAKWARATGYLPVRKSVADGMTDYFGANPGYADAFELLQYGEAEPPVPGYDFVRDEVEQATAKITNGADVAETLAKVNEDANGILADQLAQVQQ